MHLPRRLAVVVLAVSCLCLASCVESDRPLSDAASAEVDDDLVGLWAADEPGGDKEVIALGRLKQNDVTGLPKGLMHKTDVTFLKDGTLHVSPCPVVFYTTTIGKEKFMNWFQLEQAVRDGEGDKREWNDAGIKSYQLTKYEVTKGRLVIWYGDPNGSGPAGLIDAGKVAGTVERNLDQKVQKTRLTDTTEKLVEFIKDGGSKELFPDCIRPPDGDKDIPLRVSYRKLK